MLRLEGYEMKIVCGNKKNRLLASVVAVVAVTGLLNQGAVYAVPLEPGEAVRLSGSQSPLGDLVAQESLTFGINLGSPTLVASVYREKDSGNLNFVYSLTQYTSDPGFTEIIDASVTGFSNAGVDVDYDTSGSGTQHPMDASRMYGETISFQNWVTSFDSPSITPLVIRTDAKEFQSDGLFRLEQVGEGPEGSYTPPHVGTASVYTPLAGGVPEPASCVLIPVGIAALAWRTRRAR